MAREIHRLTDVEVKAKIRSRAAGMHADGAGLYLRVRDGGGASWTLRYIRQGIERWMDLGDPRDTGLADARKAARRERTKLDAGHDPLADRQATVAKARQDRRRGSFTQLAEAWFAGEVEGGTIKDTRPIRRALDKYLLPELGRTPAAEVTAAECKALLRRVAKEHPTTANDLLRYLRAIFTYGIGELETITASPVITFTVKRHAGGKEVSRNRALTRAELMQLFAALRGEPTFGGDNLLIVKLLLALAVRKGELLAAKWSEFDLDGGPADGPVWRLPADRSKTGAALDVPLAPVVVSWLRIAQELAAGSDWVFPARRRDPRRRSEHVGVDTLNVALSRVKHKLEPFTVHDFRRTARTQLAELGVAPHVAEMCLNHKPRGVEGVYNRSTYFAERRIALGSWADLLVQLAAGKTNVVPIKARPPAARRR